MLSGPMVRAAALLSVFLLTGCVRLSLAWAPITPQGEPATPPVLNSIAASGEMESVEAWEAERAAIQQILAEEIYGHLPSKSQTVVTAHRVLDEEAYGGTARFEEFDVTVTPLFGEGPAQSATFTMGVLSPKGPGPHPVIMTETFCPRWGALPHPAASKPQGTEPQEMPGVISYMFGRYICTPPLEEIIGQGFALAVVAATDVVPDSEEEGLAALRRLAGPSATEETRWGAIAAWGWVFSRMVDVLGPEARFDEDRLIAYGHSRYGKAALHAGAFDERIAGVIAHQSGTGGASLNRKKPGESVGAITKGYPHWFAPSYAAFSGREDELTLDQHHLIALVAPRPVLLGNARRDVWSDPNGGFKAAQGAMPVYALYGEEEITLDRLDRFEPDQSLSFWMRPGTHGVVEEDWPAFLAFLSAHFGG